MEEELKEVTTTAVTTAYHMRV